MLTSICTIIGATPRVLRTTDGYDIAVPDGARAFLVTRNPGAAPMLGPAAFGHLLGDAKRNDWPVFQAGRFIIYVLNRAWDSPLLAQALVTVLVDSQHQRIPSSEPERTGARLRRRLRAWARALFEPADKPAAPLPAPQPMRDDRRGAALQPAAAAAPSGAQDDGDPV